MISHSTMPYAEAVEKHRRQERIARWLGLDLVVGAVSLNVRLRTALAQRRAARLSKAAAAEGHEAVVQTVAVPLLGHAEEPEPVKSEHEVVRS